MIIWSSVPSVKTNLNRDRIYLIPRDSVRDAECVPLSNLIRMIPITNRPMIDVNVEGCSPHCLGESILRSQSHNYKSGRHQRASSGQHVVEGSDVVLMKHVELAVKAP